MLTHQDNELMCRVGPDTAMGKAARRYWIPVMQSSDLPKPDGDPRRLEIMGESYVAFRDSNGKVGILDELCCHRRASLVLGRVEGCGIRCLYHGWKFAVDGTVMETPNVKDPSFKTRFKAQAFPVREAGGLIWAYFGAPAQMPEFPHYPWFDLPASNRLNCYLVENANYVQILEALLDSSHLNILHRDGLAATGNIQQLNFSAAGDMQFDESPDIEVDDTDFGYHYAALRGGRTPDEPVLARIAAFIAPFSVVNPNEDLWMAVVPINDYQSIYFHVFWHKDKKMGEEPLSSQQMKFIGMDNEALSAFGLTYDTLQNPDRPSRANNFKQNRSSMAQGKFSGLHSFTQEDSAMVMSPGPLKDRSKERLAPVDACVMRLYRTLINCAKAARDGGEPVGLHADPMTIFGVARTIPYGTDWRTLVPTHTITRRHGGTSTAVAAE